MKRVLIILFISLSLRASEVEEPQSTWQSFKESVWVNIKMTPYYLMLPPVMVGLYIYGFYCRTKQEQIDEESINSAKASDTLK